MTTQNPTTTPLAGDASDDSRPDAAPPRWTSYLAIGDSFTEGLWDPYPGEDDHQRGWADLLAQHLALRRVEAGADPLRYGNLAIRGRKLRSILTEQVPTALELRPDLVSLIGGGNDILRPGADVDRLARNLEHAVARLRAAGIDVLLGTGFDASSSPLVGLTRPRVGVFNAHVWSIARRQGAHVLDLWGMRALQDWRMWSEDRIHLTPEGHRRVAQAALVGLGLAPDDAAWDDPLTPLPPSPVIDRARQNAQWLRAHVVPWAQRRLTGTSSGDGRLPKAPDLLPVPLAED
ncbi:lysophospholipase L1-like esterase [Cellulosimicrobium cellulans]|uniref:SGNH/GDSL hydrolase family protein n=1 Tax=Cellulosimicrobium cellulans TaxID=1710 RepID=UPI00268CDBF3|nr:lysophospholipase L1-like esterase [Cellulosimicrobium cellulans]